MKSCGFLLYAAAAAFLTLPLFTIPLGVYFFLFFVYPPPPRATISWPRCQRPCRLYRIRAWGVRGYGPWTLDHNYASVAMTEPLKVDLVTKTEGFSLKLKVFHVKTLRSRVDLFTAITFSVFHKVVMSFGKCHF